MTSFLHRTSVLSFYIDVVLTLSICCKDDNKTALLRDTDHQITRGESAAAGITTGHKIQSLFTRGFDVAKRVQLKLSETRNVLKVNGVALWRHGRGTGHNCLLLTTTSNVKCWADVANHVTRLWQAGDTENVERRIMG